MLTIQAFQCIDAPPDHPQSPSRPAILRVLQDVCSTSGQLPQQLLLSGRDVHRNDEIYERDGEACVYRGKLGSDEVLVRRLLPPNGSSWDSPEGYEYRRVRCCFVMYASYTCRPGSNRFHCASLIKQIILREIMVHWQWRHQHVLPLHGVVFGPESEETVPNLVVPFMSGGDPIRWLNDHPSPSDFVKIVSWSEITKRRFLVLATSFQIRGTVEGVVFLHTQDPPVIHGDINPVCGF